MPSLSSQQATHNDNHFAFDVATRSPYTLFSNHSLAVSFFLHLFQTFADLKLPFLFSQLLLK